MHAGERRGTLLLQPGQAGRITSVPFLCRGAQRIEAVARGWFVAGKPILDRTPDARRQSFGGANRHMGCQRGRRRGA